MLENVVVLKTVVFTAIIYLTLSNVMSIKKNLAKKLILTV